MQYKIVAAGDVDILASKVTAELKDGWNLTGGAATSDYGGFGTSFYQAMFKDDEKSSVKNELPEFYDLNLPQVAWRCLRNIGVNTTGKLLEKTKSDLMSINGFGETSLRRVCESLSNFGLSLK